MTNMFNVGKIVNTHGIKGEVKVQRITDFEDRFHSGGRLFLEKENGQLLELEIDGHRIHKGFDLVQFSGFNNINDVEQFKGLNLKIDEEQQTELDKNEFYFHEIIGCVVYLTNGEKLGIIKEILTPGANDVWVVSRKDEKDVLIPYVEGIVKEVDISEQKVTIEPMEGLLD
ncbi:ribosome maturation factor RimM [Lentibacillus amyloliquefaciens]|uniref:Ribosome maturation factor RimM n=1 Tax=Lentibacillus amyloliquefaciens TaxID=1472767 RepID=A0A0U4FNP2_9BACI|nr:ribosome maturation factor RimM [Lentibacillus amyloliquefaciens]ALX47445.1 ribosome maturation factor RimM [Lentibacillus amyloliquefaciens]